MWIILVTQIKLILHANFCMCEEWCRLLKWKIQVRSEIYMYNLVSSRSFGIRSGLCLWAEGRDVILVDRENPTQFRGAWLLTCFVFSTGSSPKKAKSQAKWKWFNVSLALSRYLVIGL